MFAISGQLGERYISRGDVAVADFDKDDLIADNDYHELDLSSLCPVGTKIVRIRVNATWGVADKAIFIRKKGYVNETNIGRWQIPIANHWVDNQQDIDIGEDRIVEYKITIPSNYLYVFIQGSVI